MRSRDIEKCPRSQEVLQTIMDIWNESYQPFMPGIKPNICPYHIGIAAALLRSRSVPEFIHDDQKEKVPGRRRIKSIEDRADATTSARFHLRLLPEEWPIAKLVFPDGGTKHMPPCSMRIFSKSFKNFLKEKMFYLPDTHELTYPDNEDNPDFESACKKLVDLADRQMEDASVTAKDAYDLASQSAYNGIMRIPKGIRLPKNNAPADVGFTYFIPNFISKECKIGYSKDIFSRSAVFKIGRGSIPMCMAILRGGLHTEKLAKMKNNKSLIGGEVYHLEPVFQWLIRVGEGHLRELLQWKP